MYPPSSSSSSSRLGLGPGQGPGSGPGQGQGQSNRSSLSRYDSAPGSFLAAVDSVIGQARSKELSPLGAHPYFSTSSAVSGVTSNASNAKTAPDHNLSMNGLQRSYASSSPSPSSPNSASLTRHSSLPAGFLNRVASAASADNGTSHYSSYLSPVVYIMYELLY